MKVLVTLLLVMFSAHATANDYGYDSVDSYELNTIQVDGNYTQKRMSAADKLKKLRKRLEKKNEDMVKKNIATIRIKNELELMKKMQNMFNQQLKALDSLGN